MLEKSSSLKALPMVVWEDFNIISSAHTRIIPRMVGCFVYAYGRPEKELVPIFLPDSILSVRPRPSDLFKPPAQDLVDCLHRAAHPVLTQSGNHPEGGLQQFQLLFV